MAFAIAIQGLFNGRSNAAGKVTLAAGAASTVVSAPNCAAQCSVFLFQASAHAAAELAAGGCYVSAVGKQQFTITHANNSQVDRTFFYVCIG
ncbi:hypothetical protein [Bradyrhizobium genosp. A]|uniref:hypothetical protein n=1 Tax=Bradyrhizobium genosp. A TaxID=83626 RepID=UPI003CF7EC12